MCLQGVAHAQVYKWVDANGKVTFSDTPPPTDAATRVETKNYGSSGSDTSTLPFELAKAVRSMPVTLYTTTNCPPCEDGKNYLKQSGIPFVEKTVTTDADVRKITALTGNTQMPVATVGPTKLIGYNSGDWRNALSLAGYPETNMLPSDYQFAPAQPAAPVAPPKETRQAPAPTDQVPERDPDAFHF